MKNCEKPVIAALKGAAAGTGLSLALADVKVEFTLEGGAIALLSDVYRVR